MLSHFHPSVSVSTSHILEHKPLSGKPDLTIHTLSHFLDRFIYRNSAKAAGVQRGTSIMQPLAGTDSHDLLVSASGLAGLSRAQEPLNSEAFWRKRTEDVAAEDVFFHEYFNRLGKDKTNKEDGKKAKDPVERDEEGGSDSDGEDEIWQALVESRPELEGDDDDDDLDMDDLESAFDDDDDDEVDVDGLDDDEGVIFNDESDEDDDEEADADDAPKRGKAQSKEEDEDEDEFNMDASDEEAFRDSDEDLPSDLDIDMDEDMEMEMGGVALPSSSAGSASGKKGAEQKKKKRKLKHLPTFASADDYAALLADEDDGQA